MDLSQVINVLLAAITVFSAVTVWRKTRSESGNLDSQTMRNYQEMLRQATADIKGLRIQTDQQELEIRIIKAELAKQTERADDYQRKADIISVEKIQLTQRVGHLEAILQRIYEWAQRCKPQLEAAGIEPMPTE